MGIFGFGKSYSKEDLDKEIAKLRTLYNQAMTQSSPQLKRELTIQLQNVLEVCRKGVFSGGETVEWTSSGCFTSLQM